MTDVWYKRNVKMGAVQKVGSRYCVLNSENTIKIEYNLIIQRRRIVTASWSDAKLNKGTGCKSPHGIDAVSVRIISVGENQSLGN